jgi:hypothetical protein
MSEHTRTVARHVAKGLGRKVLIIYYILSVLFVVLVLMFLRELWRLAG